MSILKSLALAGGLATLVSGCSHTNWTHKIWFAEDQSYACSYSSFTHGNADNPYQEIWQAHDKKKCVALVKNIDSDGDVTYSHEPCPLGNPMMGTRDSFNALQICEDALTYVQEDKNLKSESNIPAKKRADLDE